MKGTIRTVCYVALPRKMGNCKPKRHGWCVVQIELWMASSLRDSLHNSNLRAVCVFLKKTTTILPIHPYLFWRSYVYHKCRTRCIIWIKILHSLKAWNGVHEYTLTLLDVASRMRPTGDKFVMNFMVPEMWRLRHNSQQLSTMLSLAHCITSSVKVYNIYLLCFWYSFMSHGSALWRLQHNSREMSSFPHALCARSCALGLEICQMDCVSGMNIVLCMQSLRCHYLGRQSHELCSGTLSSQRFRALLAPHMYLWTPSSGLSLYAPGGSRIKQTRTSPWKYIVPSDK